MYMKDGAISMAELFLILDFFGSEEQYQSPEGLDLGQIS